MLRSGACLLFAAVATKSGTARGTAGDQRAWPLIDLLDRNLLARMCDKVVATSSSVQSIVLVGPGSELQGDEE